MPLVPILYTALLIFVSFSVIIVVISYVSYKVRQKSLREDEQSDGEYYNNYYSQPTIEKETRDYSTNTPNSIKVVSTIKKPDERKTVELPYYHDYQQTAPVPARSSKYYTTVNNNSDHTAQHYSKSGNRHTGYEKDSRREYEEPQPKNYQDESRTRTNPGRSRIEILNKQQPAEKRENSPRERYHSSGSGHIALPKYFAGFQAISYYSEEEEEAFFKASQYTKE